MKKLLTILLALSMIIISLPSVAEAQTNSKEEADLYISSARELNEFALNVNNGNSYKGKTIKLTKDIVFDGITPNNFTTIGYSRNFNGTFDGAGYTISGIDITYTNGSYNAVGLFGFIGEGGVVKNVIFSNSSMTISKDTIYGEGAIAGCNYGTIENCHSDNITISSSTSVRAGGIVGTNKFKGIILYCTSDTQITVVNSSVSQYGGIAAYNDGTISNSSNYGNISVNSSSSKDNTDYVGGVVGDNDYKGTVMNCFNVGILTGNIQLAGIVGNTDGIVANCSCSEESAAQNIYKSGSSSVSKNNKAYPASEMKSAAFTDTLNDNRGSNASWLKWVTSELEYPTLITYNEVTFKTIKNGLVKTNRSYAYEGQTVTLTATANAKYKTSKVLVTTVSGKKVTVNKKSGKYQFKMPSEKVVVSVTFVKK